MMKATFSRPATVADALSVAQRLRKADRDEVLAAGGVEPLLALPAIVREGREVYACGLADDGIPELLWGLDPIPFCDDTAVIWLLSTDRLYDYPVEFVTASKKGLEEAHQRYPILTNFIDARNTRHIRWLRWMGFYLIRRVESFGAQSLPFIEFASIRPCA